MLQHKFILISIFIWFYAGWADKYQLEYAPKDICGQIIQDEPSEGSEEIRLQRRTLFAVLYPKQDGFLREIYSLPELSYLEKVTADALCLAKTIFIRNHKYSTWYFPLLMQVWKLGPESVCGHPLNEKQTPLSGLYIAQLCKEAGFPSGVVNTFPGYGPIAGAAISGHIHVDKVVFTGSTQIGHKIARDASKLSGKRPSLFINTAALILAVVCFFRIAQYAYSSTTSSNVYLCIFVYFIHQTSACVCKSSIMAYCDRDDNPADLRFEWCAATVTQLYLASDYSCDFDLLATVPVISEVYILGSAPCKCFCNLGSIYTNCTSCISDNHSPNNSAKIAVPTTLAIIIAIIVILIVYCKCIKTRRQGDNKKPVLPTDNRNAPPIPPRPFLRNRSTGTQSEERMDERMEGRMDGRMEGREERRDTEIKTEIETQESDQLIDYSDMRGQNPNGPNPNGPNLQCPILQGPYPSPPTLQGPNPQDPNAAADVDMIDI